MIDEIFTIRAYHFEKYCCPLSIFVLIQIGGRGSYKDLLVLPDYNEAAKLLFEVLLFLDLGWRSLEVKKAVAVSYPGLEIKF